MRQFVAPVISQLKVSKSFLSFSVERLIASSPSLRQAYQACGILPAPIEREKPADMDREAAAKGRLVKSVIGVQARLRRFSGAKIVLDASTRGELLAAKAAIDRLFESIIG